MNATHEGQDAADVLERAADEMERRGKCCTDWMDSNNRVCALGAIAVVNGWNGRGLWREADAFVPPKVKAAITRFIGTEFIGTWSDERDQPTVTSTLRAVAATERARAATLRAQQAAPVAAPVYAEMES